MSRLQEKIGRTTYKAKVAYTHQKCSRKNVPHMKLLHDIDDKKIKCFIIFNAKVLTLGYILIFQDTWHISSELLVDIVSQERIVILLTQIQDRLSHKNAQ